MSSQLLSNKVTTYHSQQYISRTTLPCILIVISYYSSLHPHHCYHFPNGYILLSTLISLSAGFAIHGMHSTHFTPQLAEDLMDVYKGIYPLYSQMIEHLAEAPLLAVMITGTIVYLRILSSYLLIILISLPTNHSSHMLIY